GPAELDRHVAALDVSPFAQAFTECLQVFDTHLRRTGSEKSDHRHRRLLPSRALHLGREQQAAATEQCNELTPLAVEHRGLPPPCASAADWPLRSVFRTPACRRVARKSLGQT